MEPPMPDPGGHVHPGRFGYSAHTWPQWINVPSIPGRVICIHLADLDITPILGPSGYMYGLSLAVWI